MSQVHSQQATTDGIHIVHAFVYTNEASRLASTLASTDVGRVALQSDTNSAWILVQNPSTWKQLVGEPIVRTDGTTARTFALTDAGCVVRFTNAASIAANVPLNASVPFPIGSAILIDQSGAGQVTLAGAGGVTLNSTGTLKTKAQHAQISLMKVGTDEWNVSGERA